MTITYVQARDAIVAHIDTAMSAGYPSAPVFYENTRAIDADKTATPFVRVDINFMDERQADIGPNPIDRVFGEVHFRVFVKEGEGTRTPLALFDFIFNFMKRKNLSGVQTETPHSGKKTSKNGLVASDLIVPFWFDSI